MTTQTLRTLVPLLLAASGASLHLQAQAHGSGDPDTEGSQWGLGIAVMSEISPYRDVDDKTEVWPLLTFENRWVRLFGPGIELKLGTSGPLSFGLTANYARDGYEANDSPVLAGMAERKASVWLGARVGLRSDIAEVTAEWSADGASHSKGQQFKLGAEHRFALGDFGLTPRLSATWQDRKYVQYYYGVAENEARAGRAAYTPGSAINTEIGLRLDYRLAPQQILFADLGVNVLDSRIKNSPLVDRSSLPEVRAGWMHRF